MTHVTRTTGSGLVLREYAMGEAQLQRALTQIDKRFVLWPPDGMSPYYRVIVNLGEDQEARTVCTWMDVDGKPLPLSSGILDAVDKLRLDARNKPLDEDAANKLREERLAKEKADRGEAIMGEHKAKIERGRTSVSFGPLTRLSEIPRRRKAA